MSQRRSRIQRKAARVVKTEADREFDAGLAELRRELHAALVAANEDHRRATAKLDGLRAVARAKAQKTYDEKRAELLKRVAAKEAA